MRPKNAEKSRPSGEACSALIGFLYLGPGCSVFSGQAGHRPSRVALNWWIRLFFGRGGCTVQDRSLFIPIGNNRWAEGVSLLRGQAGLKDYRTCPGRRWLRSRYRKARGCEIRIRLHYGSSFLCLQRRIRRTSCGCYLHRVFLRVILHLSCPKSVVSAK